MIIYVILQHYGSNNPGYGPISVPEARLLTSLFLIALLIAFLFWKFGNAFGKLRDWYRTISHVPFERLSQEKQRRILNAAYCLGCGQLDNLVAPKHEVLRGEHVVTGNCPKCRDKVVVRL